MAQQALFSLLEKPSALPPLILPSWEFIAKSTMRIFTGIVNW
jgi:hypothetical protein